ncbi:fatty acid hydroxylase family protein, partial [Providencia rettgeri]|nr:fatty acid hydroxylase family protein [Providencia rettgeri]
RRGLLGHLFNGYSGKRVKEELKPILRRFRFEDTVDTTDGPALQQEEAHALERGLAN